MKTIQVSEEDYKTLMELSKELQTQENHSQAFPYFWEPRSEKLKPNIHGEGEEVTLIKDGEEVDLEELFNSNDELRNSFLDYEGETPALPWEDVEELDFARYLENNFSYQIYTQDWEAQSEHNPSFFMSDVKNFIKCNSHHLGRNPHTYARTIWRLPKMEALVKAVLNLNKTHGEEVNEEAKRFIK